MTATILSILTEHIWPLVALVGGLILALFARQSGANAEKARQAKAERAARDIANEAEAGVDAMPSDQAREELKKWSRK